MSKLNKVLKPVLKLVMSTAFVFLMVNVSTTCCGPAYQPKLPENIKKAK